MVATATLLQELTADPKAFLRHYDLSIAGGGQVATKGIHSGVATFDCAMMGGTVTGFTTRLAGLRGKTKERERVRFTFVSLPALQNLGVDQFDAWYIAMAQQGAGTTTTHFTLPGNGGPNLMLTSQLTGCTFGIGSQTDQGSRLVSHVQPLNGNPDQPTRDGLRRVVSNGLTDGVAALYGRDSQPDDGYGDGFVRATIVATRRGTNWTFWAQESRRDSGDILRVRRLA